ncbi:MAG: alpha/beta fold hydrolase [Elusimicrobiales bacterium]
MRGKRFGAVCAAAAVLLAACGAASVWAFPKDFPELKGTGGQTAGKILTGFGGDEKLDKAGNRAGLKHVPVILLHGNSGSATHAQWGMVPIRDMLFKAGYNTSEVWAVSYEGDNPYVELMGVHKTHIEDVRAFINAVRDYLGVKKVDVVAHSLGTTMTLAYMAGYDSSGKFNPQKRGYGNISTFVSLAGANNGLGQYSVDEFKTGGDFVKGISAADGVADQTPYGSADEGKQTQGYRQVTSLDNGQITYAALWAAGDFVDAQLRDTGSLKGADINKSFDLGSNTNGHEKIMKDQAVFNTFLPYLNRGKAAGDDREKAASREMKAEKASAASARGFEEKAASINPARVMNWDGPATRDIKPR